MSEDGFEVDVTEFARLAGGHDPFTVHTVATLLLAKGYPRLSGQEGWRLGKPNPDQIKVQWFGPGKTRLATLRSIRRLLIAEGYLVSSKGTSSAEIMLQRPGR